MSLVPAFGGLPSALDLLIGPMFPFAPPGPVTARDGNSYAFEIAVPGMSRSDVVVSLDGNAVVVEGKRRQARGPALKYAFTLPRDADADALQARVRDGLLRITCPRSAQRPGRRIDVQ